MKSAAGRGQPGPNGASLIEAVIPKPKPPPLTFTTLAETPRYKGIIQPEERAIDRANMAQAAEEQPQEQQPRWSYQGTQNRALNTRLPETDARMRGEGKMQRQKMSKSDFAAPRGAPLHGRPSPGNAGPKSQRVGGKNTSPNFASTVNQHLPSPSGMGGSDHYPLVPVSPSSQNYQLASASPRNRQYEVARVNRQARPDNVLPMNHPHRVQPPPFMNAPPRLPAPTSSSSSATSPSSSLRKATMAKIQDYALRANACKRAGRRRAEANAYYAMGVCYDNLGLASKAIACYKSFAEVLEGSEDKFAQALAMNCIGVAYQNLALAIIEDGTSNPELSGKRRAYLQMALRHHAAHRDCADGQGRFLAQSNMGLCYGSLDDLANATEQHQSALKSAIHLSSVAGQSAAIGNLGLTALHSKDFDTARACMERHLQMSASMCDTQGETNALRLLGEIASKQGQYEQASQLFWESMNGSPRGGRAENEARDLAKVKLGIARANAIKEERMREVQKHMREQQMLDAQS